MTIVEIYRGRLLKKNKKHQGVPKGFLCPPVDVEGIIIYPIQVIVKMIQGFFSFTMMYIAPLLITAVQTKLL